MIARVNDNDYEVETGACVAFHVRVDRHTGEEETYNIANTESYTDSNTDSNRESKPSYYYSHNGNTNCNPD
jgi:hypothetical protein